MQKLEGTDFYQGFVQQQELFSSQLPAADLRQYINSFWSLHVKTGAFNYRGVPDNCVDWIINLDNPDQSVLVSPHSTPLNFNFSGPANYFGIRFKTLAQYSFTNTPIAEWEDAPRRIGAKEYLSDSQVLKAPEVLDTICFHQVIEILSRETNFILRCLETEKIFRKHLLQTPNTNKALAIDNRLLKFIDFSMHHPGSGKLHMEQLVQEIGMSSRQLRRLSHLYLGVSPKDYLKVLRFQKSLHLLNTQSRSAPWLDYYFDQSHFIREFKALTGATPGQFMKMSVLSNQNCL